MTDEDIEFEEAEAENPDESPGDLRKRLKEEAKARKAAEKRARSAELKDAMNEAGLKLGPQTKFALSHYEGDTDVESVKSFFAEHGFLQEQAAEAASAGEGQAHEQISQAAAGGEATHLQGDEEKAHAELRALAAGMHGNTDPFKLQQEATAIMAKYNLPMTYGDDDGGVYTPRG